MGFDLIFGHSTMSVITIILVRPIFFSPVLTFLHKYSSMQNLIPSSSWVYISLSLKVSHSDLLNFSKPTLLSIALAVSFMCTLNTRKELTSDRGSEGEVTCTTNPFIMDGMLESASGQARRLLPSCFGFLKVIHLAVYVKRGTYRPSTL